MSRLHKPGFRTVAFRRFGGVCSTEEDSFAGSTDGIGGGDSEGARPRSNAVPHPAHVTEDPICHAGAMVPAPQFGQRKRRCFVMAGPFGVKRRMRS
jgi:hypothetical protein